jgi:hypothetical protein
MPSASSPAMVEHLTFEGEISDQQAMNAALVEECQRPAAITSGPLQRDHGVLRHLRCPLGQKSAIRSALPLKGEIAPSAFVLR